jgi:hypothetical protein
MGGCTRTPILRASSITTMVSRRQNALHYSEVTR